MSNNISKSQEYRDFRASVPFKTLCVDKEPSKGWTVNEVNCTIKGIPLVLFPPIGGRADVFFKQLLVFSTNGAFPIEHRMISVDYPVYWSCEELVEGFKRLIDSLEFEKMHLFGASLGGFVAQKFAEKYPNKVSSLILCNSFISTNIFEESTSSSYFWMLPAMALRRILTTNLRLLLPSVNNVNNNNSITNNNIHNNNIHNNNIHNNNINNNNFDRLNIASSINDSLDNDRMSSINSHSSCDDTMQMTDKAFKKNNNKNKLNNKDNNSTNDIKNNTNNEDKLNEDEKILLLNHGGNGGESHQSTYNDVFEDGDDGENGGENGENGDKGGGEDGENGGEEEITNSIKFMIDSVSNMRQKQLSCRLTLNCTPCFVKTEALQAIPTTIITTKDNQALNESLKKKMASKYPRAKRVEMKMGGHFPFLSRPSELNKLIMDHLNNLPSSLHHTSSTTPL